MICEIQVDRFVYSSIHTSREKEQEEIKRRRALPEEERLREDLERARMSREKDKSEHTFLQKYYHKGAFYMVRIAIAMLELLIVSLCSIDRLSY